MEFKQLEAFVAVVENKSFSEAARQLNLTQPTISAHINSLEQELNSRLLIRTTKKLTITQRGLQLYDCASNMLNMRSNIIEEFKSLTWPFPPFPLPIFCRKSSVPLPARLRTYTSTPGNLTVLALWQGFWTAAWIWPSLEIPSTSQTAVSFHFVRISL